MFHVSVLNRIPFAFTLEVRLCEVSPTLFECDIVAIAQQGPPSNRSDWMQRTDTWATAGVQDGVRAFCRVIAFHIDKRKLDCPALWIMTIFRHDQQPTTSLVEIISLVDTVTRF